jgi:GT2 family glycosyltransferase
MARGGGMAHQARDREQACGSHGDGSEAAATTDPIELPSLVQAPLLRRVARLPRRLLRAALRRTCVLTAEPLRASDEIPNSVEPTADALLLSAPGGRYPHGWTLMRMHIAAQPDADVYLRLCFDMGGGFDAAQCQMLPVPAAARGSVQFIQYLPPGVRRLRLDSRISSWGAPVVAVSSIEVSEITKQEALVRSGLKLLRRQRGDLRALETQARSLFGALHAAGVAGVVAHAQSPLRHAAAAYPGWGEQFDTVAYPAWVQQFDTLRESDRSAIRNRVLRLPSVPRFSVILILTDVDQEVAVRRSVQAVMAQLYPHWELWVVGVRGALARFEEVLRTCAAEDGRVRWLSEEAPDYASAAHRGLGASGGEYLVLLDASGEMREHALYLVAEEFNLHPQARLIFGDEDHLDAAGSRTRPSFKPDWNADLFYAQDFLGPFIVYARDLVVTAGGPAGLTPGAERYDLALRATANLPPRHIRHITHVLFHLRSVRSNGAAACAALRAHLERQGIEATVEPLPTPGLRRVRYRLPTPAPAVTLIIPTRDRLDLLQRCVDSILLSTSYPSFQLLIVDNQSRERPTLDYLARVEHHPNVRVVRYDAPFNYSAINNFAADLATTPLIGLLNNDLEIVDATWLEEMASQAMRPGIGAVGAKLYYPDRTVQHAGVILGLGEAGGRLGVAGHVHKHLAKGDSGPGHRAGCVQVLSAVTAACLVVRRALYWEVGGLDETLRVAFNDIDFCLKLQQQGQAVLWTPHAELLHHESATRGAEDSPAKIERFHGEVALMRRRWGALLGRDPYYNPNLTLERPDFGLAVPPRVDKPWHRGSRMLNRARALSHRPTV